MKLRALEAVVLALNAAGVRYLVAGGLAVNAHGYLRYTADIDLVIALDADNIHGAFDALAKIGYRPIVPISAEQFANEKQRRRWSVEKGMQVLNFVADAFPETSVDVFVQEPFDFRKELGSAMTGEMLPGVPVQFVSIETLIRMKQAAGRLRDQDDIQHLRLILDDEKKR
jgi:hypothetical protein